MTIEIGSTTQCVLQNNEIKEVVVVEKTLLSDGELVYVVDIPHQQIVALAREMKLPPWLKKFYKENPEVLGTRVGLVMEDTDIIIYINDESRTAAVETIHSKFLH